MTVFTVDVSSNQAGLTVTDIKAAGFSGMMARCSSGKNPDREYSRFMDEAAELVFPFGAYHFLKSHIHTAITVQVNACLAAIGDTSIPLMLDVESDVNSLPDWTDVVNFQRLISAQGKACNSLYLPRWYWELIRKPDITLPLIASAYGKNLAGVAEELYPGDDKWPAAYGGRVPVLWQFGSRGTIDDYGGSVDINAFKGSTAQLVSTRLMTGWGSDDMAEIDAVAPGAAKTIGDAVATSLVNRGLGGATYDGNVAEILVDFHQNMVGINQKLDALIQLLTPAQ